ncbi:MAG: helix-turn-helix domain-containing protein [Kiloniellaceae bacterium]
MLLDRLLRGLDVSIDAFAICEVRREASFVLDEDRTVSIHYILSGEGVARPMTGPAIALAPHTVIIMPPAVCLVVSCGRERGMTLPAPECRPLPGGWEWATVGSGAPGILMACGTVRATHRQIVGTFDYLRSPLVESVATDVAFQEPFHRLLDELAAPRPGTKTLAEVLMKQCLIVLLRRHWESGEGRAPWLAALGHPQLGRAIAAMLDRPDAIFTLQSLADIAGMSRATFAERFKEAFGRTAMGFLKEVRLRRAAELLIATDLPVKTIAGRVGFASRSHFSRAFKAFAGADPAGYRAAASDGTPDARTDPDAERRPAARRLH